MRSKWSKDGASGKRRVRGKDFEELVDFREE